MAKKSRKRPVRLKKDNAGCMSGLISMFDFRQGRFTQRLLSDKSANSRHGGIVSSRSKIDLRRLEEKQENVNDIDEKGEGTVSGKASIKALMAEEMSAAHNSKKFSSSKIEQLRAELGFGPTLEKNHNTTNKIRKFSSDCYYDRSRASQSTWSDPTESSSFEAKLAEFMEFCSENQMCQEKCTEHKANRLTKPDSQLTEKQYIFKKALSDITEALLTDMTTDSEQITSRHAVQPKDFMDGLATLSSNKEAFLKLVQDPDSLIFQQVLDIQNQNARPDELLHENKPEEPIDYQLSHRQSRRSFFRRKDKSDEAKSLSENAPQDLKRIVVLKPSPNRHQQFLNTVSPISSPRSYHNLQHPEGTGRASSHFSLKEIKRRLRNVIGESRKDRHLIAMDGILHKVPYGYKNEDESSKTSTSSQQSSKLSKFLRRGNISSSFKDQSQTEEALTTAQPSYRESVFYEEARQRLAEMLGSGSQSDISSRQVSKQLGRILLMPGYNSLSPCFSPGRDKEIDSPRLNRISSLAKNKQGDFTAMNNLSTESIVSCPCSDKKQDEGEQLIGKSPTLLETQLDVEDDSIPNGSGKTEETESADLQVEFSADEPNFASERCNQEESCTSSELEPFREEQSPAPCVSIEPDSLLATKFQSCESPAEYLDRPSPASVLEPFFSEINSPEATETNPAEWIVEPRQLRFEEPVELILTSTVSQTNPTIHTEDKGTKLEYVRTVLEASGLIYNQLPERHYSSDQLLDPFVYDEVEISYDQLVHDSKLLFDCINEVLVEIQKRYLLCNPWISFIKPRTRPYPTGEKFVQEVCKGIDWHLSRKFPCTLDQVVRKDLDGGNWMNVRLETEGAVFDIGEVILEYIMEETILELWE